MSNENSILGRKSWHLRPIINYNGTVFYQIYTIIKWYYSHIFPQILLFLFLTSDIV